MAIEREIPKDINKYEAKFVGPLTTRQTVCAVPAVILAIGIITLLKDLVARDVCIVTAIIVAVPWILCGWVKIGGLPFEKFIQTAFVSMVLAPKHRTYKTVNMHEKALASFDLPNNNAKQQKEKIKKAQKYKSKEPQLKAYK